MSEMQREGLEELRFFELHDSTAVSYRVNMS